MARWTFLRHGESTANASGRFAGHRDVPLTPTGEGQARSVGKLLTDQPFDRALVSDLQRATRTLELARPDLPTTTLKGLRERSMGEWEQADREAVRALGGFRTLLEWDGRPPGGESLSDLTARVLATLAAHDTGQNTLVVCHGGVMRSVLGVLDGATVEELAQRRYRNCAAEHREVPTGRWAQLLASR